MEILILNGDVCMTKVTLYFRAIAIIIGAIQSASDLTCDGGGINKRLPTLYELYLGQFLKCVVVSSASRAGRRVRGRQLAAAAGARAAAGRPHKKLARTWASPRLPTCTKLRAPQRPFLHK